MVHPKKCFGVLLFLQQIEGEINLSGVQRCWQCAPAIDAFCAVRKSSEYQQSKPCLIGILQKMCNLPLRHGLGYWSSQSNLTSIF